MPRDVFCLKRISLVIPGMIEPWPECQPEQSWDAWASFGPLLAPLPVVKARASGYTSVRNFIWQYDPCIIWPPHNNLANLVIYGVFIKKRHFVT